MRLFALALVLALAPAASAQIIPSIDLGVAGGVNFGSLGDASDAELESSTGFHAGVYADVSALFFSARTGLFYQRIGDIPGAGDGTEDGTVSFVTVPVDFIFQTPTPIAKAYALIGPEFRFPLGDLNLQGAVAGDEDLVSVNTALNVGIGAKAALPVVGPSGFVELRYAYDLTGIADTDSDQSYKVNVVMLRVGVGI